ncbi:unnamed protein product [Rotaria sp. Silwood2]|nr:unnamed protein product [Rotaria sp. Silwood2]
MNQSNVSLLDLPNEILIIILMKRDIMDVLYSMMNIGNQRVANLVLEKTFTKSLNFVLITPNDNIFSIDDSILNRFYINILPRIDHNVKSLILESVSVQRILLSANCPNLTELKIFKLQRTNLCTAFCSRGFNQIDLRPNEDIHQTFKYFKDYQIISCIDYFQKRNRSQCHIYSYPYQLIYYNKTTNNFSGGLLKYVFYISLFDEHPFEHEFFLQISQSFPFLKRLCLVNDKGQNNKQCIKSNNHHQNLSIIKYPYLTELNFLQAHKDYIEQFLLDTKTYLPFNVSFL